MLYKTEVRDNINGTASHGVAFVFDDNGATWRSIGQTETYHDGHHMLTARVAAKNLCRAHWKRRRPRAAFTYVVA